ncbi:MULTISPECIES: hypothetical protein [unclassified Meiothermus]|uniref:hypothetical protein n=1 Tax=unclassified Meiothermus TaxID=370471 RepID=UPI000D7D1986|nr:MULTISPECIES: hypothetical protein [unclassified Meiothermus]PZA06493.1 hypothetical protein DNA98_12975 [Meiothermus sp. Pnk-1]RYM36240.1 hypothetical protein EWH23_10560 [Meiothermus sp. PNK-Is4]
MIRFALNLIAPDRMNTHGIGVYGTEVVPGWEFPQAWLEAAKTYRPDLPEHLSALAWMLAVHSGQINVGGYYPVWALGRVEEAQALVQKGGQDGDK